MAHLRNYCMGVLLGNWWEERIFQSDMKKQEKLKKKNIETVTKVLCSLTEPLNNLKLESSSNVRPDFVKNGSFVQMVNPGISKYYEKAHLSKPRSEFAIALGITSFQRLFVLLQNVQTSVCPAELIRNLQDEGNLKVVGTSKLNSTYRTTFRIHSFVSDGESKPIRYGQPVMFCLEPKVKLSSEMPPTNGTALYLASDFERIGDPRCHPGAQPLFFECDTPSFSAQWRIEAEDSRIRTEMEGSPVRFNDRIIIKHIRTNKALALEPDHSARNLFGLDVQISANTYYDSHKAERDVNVWTLRAAGTVDGESEIKQSVTSETAEDVAMEGTVTDGRILLAPEKA